MEASSLIRTGPTRLALRLGWHDLYFRRFAGRRLNVGPRSKLPAVVELDPAEAAMIQLPAGNFVERVPQTRHHLIDLIDGSQFSQAISAAPRAPDLIAEMERVLPRNQLFAVAVTALVDRQIFQSFEKVPVNALQPASA